MIHSKFTLSTFLWLAISASLQAQDKVPFNGLLRDLQGNGVKGAVIYVKSPNIYTKSAKSGRFGLTDVQPTDTLKILYKKLRYDVPVDGRKSLAIRLIDSQKYESEESQELVDLGYKYVSHREYTSSNGRITGDELRANGYTNLMDALRGKVPGMNVSNPSASGQSSITMRGTSSLYGSSAPLFMVDGVEVSDFNGINIQDVDYVEVLKDGSMYGVKGSNGVIVVKTKTR